MKQTTHSFNVEDAEKFGVESAVLLYNIRHWLDKNKANQKHIHDGRVWTYNSTRAFSELFPYLTEKQIYTRLKNLEDDGILMTGNYNQNSYDRTKWYSVNEPEYAFSQTEKSISPNGKMELPKRENRNSQTVEPIPDINTDINTDNKPDINTDSVGEINFPKCAEYSEEAIEVAMYLKESIIDENPAHAYATDEPAVDTWAIEIERSMRKHGRTTEQYRYIIDWIFKTDSDDADFWKPNIQSGKKLIKHFDRIVTKIKLQRKKKAKTNGRTTEQYEERHRKVEAFFNKLDRKPEQRSGTLQPHAHEGDHASHEPSKGV